MVYGVTVPGADGRACMATVVADDGLDLAAFRTHVDGRLPCYAHPLFLRVLQVMPDDRHLQVHEQLNWRGRAFDPDLATGVLYFNARERNAFVPLDRALFERIQTGQVSPMTPLEDAVSPPASDPERPQGRAAFAELCRLASSLELEIAGGPIRRDGHARAKFAITCSRRTTSRHRAIWMR